MSSPRACTYATAAPPHAQPTLCAAAHARYHPGHNPNPGAGGACKAVDIPRFLSELVGESYHDDHHDHPKKVSTNRFEPFPHSLAYRAPHACYARQAHRPGLDLPYQLVLAPLVVLGLIW